MAAGFSVMLCTILIFLGTRKQYCSELWPLLKFKNEVLTVENGLYKDGQFSRSYEPDLLWQVKIHRSMLESKFNISFVAVRSTRHGSATLALPSKSFVVDLTIYMDISSNPGPSFQNNSKTKKIKLCKSRPTTIVTLGRLR